MLCASVCLSSVAYVPLSFLRPPLGMLFYRMALISGFGVYGFRAYIGLKEPLKFNREYYKKLTASNNFGLTAYCWSFIFGTPFLFALVPINCYCLYQLMTHFKKVAATNPLMVRFGDKLYDYLHNNRHQAVTLCCTIEIVLGFHCIMGLFTPARALLQCFIYWQVLKARYHCNDHIVLKLVMSYQGQPLSPSFVHRQIWMQLGQKAEFVFRYVPILRKPLGLITNWFTNP